MLARGELKCVGATTLDEYRQYVEKDAALERRFQTVMVDEPTVEETISILRGLKERYEIFHGIRIMDSAIVASAQLSHRYITDRFLPDKAIDLMDEAASRLKIEVNSVPADIDEVERHIRQLEIDRQALKKEEDEASKKRLETLEIKLSELNIQAKDLREVWTKEKEKIEEVRSLKQELENLKNQLQQAERDMDWSKAAEIQYGFIPNIQAKQKSFAEQLSKEGEPQMLKEAVTEEDIAEIVSKWTGIPVNKLLEGEMQKLLQMEEILGERVVGQKEAIQSLSDAVRRARSGISDPNRPIGSFLFLGPTGVGKTETAKALAEFLFDEEKAMVRIDMSEYSEKHSIARLIGAPPGYVGYEEGGQLTEIVRRRPYSVILLDEVEKAHPEIFNVLLQVLDEGRLTDGQGRTVDFRNTVILLTSNLGSHYYKEALLTQDQFDEIKQKVLEEVQAYFRPELLNRLDDIIVFHSIGASEIQKIARIQFEKLSSRLSERRINLNLTEKAEFHLGVIGFDPIYGARPLKRTIQNKILNPLAQALLKGEFKDGDGVLVDLKEDQFMFLKQ